MKEELASIIDLVNAGTRADTLMSVMSKVQSLSSFFFFFFPLLSFPLHSFHSYLMQTTSQFNEKVKHLHAILLKTAKILEL